MNRPPVITSSSASRFSDTPSSCVHTGPCVVLPAFISLLIAFFLSGALLFPLTATAQQPEDPIYLPALARDRSGPRTSLVITTSIVLSQNIDVDHFAIVPGVTVTAPSTLTIRVRESLQIGGALIADCHPITLHAQRTPGSGIIPSVIITGTLDNRCADPLDEGGDLTIWSENGDLQIGLPAQPADVQTSGDLLLANDDLGPTWPYALLPEHRATEPSPPACTVYADTLVDVVGLDSSGDILPAMFTFFAEGIDPNLGPLHYAWDFGDGATLSPGPATVEHAYATPGLYTVTLTVAKDGLPSPEPPCQASLTVLALDAAAEYPAQPEPSAGIEPDLPEDAGAPHPQPAQPPGVAVSLELLDLALPVDAPLHVGIDALDARFAATELAYAIDWGDGTQAANLATMAPTHTYTAAGVYSVLVTVTNPVSEAYTATGTVYVYHPALASTAAPDGTEQAAPQQNVCAAPPANAFFLNQADVANPPAAGQRPNGNGRNGSSITLRARGDLIIAPGVLISGQNGGDGAADAGGPVARGKPGGAGGSLTILARGRLTICGGVVLEAGSGGNGGDATALGGPGITARATGGRGGRAANRLQIQGQRGIDIAGPNVTLNPGNGGLGGTAFAIGGNGEDRCPAGQHAGSAFATAGPGGKASKLARISGRVTGLANVTVAGGLGGNGGDATARAGAGGHAQCDDEARGGSGGDALARGGHGGPARLGGQLNVGFALAANAFTGGDGGTANAIAGEGGNGTATPSAACMDTRATGGGGGRATAYGGNGARGRIDGTGGPGSATGGMGGSATATGGDCAPCQDGGQATARGGNGGSARALNGRLIQNPGDGQAEGGNGGNATATGGAGGDCPCAGDGGAGGNALATGGRGGRASGSQGIISTGGDGGHATATGGPGGDAGDCCKPDPQPAGNGGAGGNATAQAGYGSLPDGARGTSAGSGGAGGNGGDGNGPGLGGDGGSGTGSPNTIPDGPAGADGDPCPPRIATRIAPSIEPTTTTPGGVITVTVVLLDQDNEPMRIDGELYQARLTLTQDLQPTAPPQVCFDPAGLSCTAVFSGIDAAPGTALLTVEIYNQDGEPLGLQEQMTIPVLEPAT